MQKNHHRLDFLFMRKNWPTLSDVISQPLRPWQKNFTIFFIINLRKKNNFCFWKLYLRPNTYGNMKEKQKFSSSGKWFIASIAKVSPFLALQISPDGSGKQLYETFFVISLKIFVLRSFSTINKFFLPSRFVHEKSLKLWWQNSVYMRRILSLS